MNDEKIIELVRLNKNSTALNDLYKYFPVVRKTIVANGGSADDAADVFQEGLIILIKKIKSTDFKLTARLSTYLFSVCRFVWKDELKKRGRLITEEISHNDEEIEFQELEETIANEGAAKLAERALADLRERCRELLLLFYNTQMKLRDIATKMDYSSENVAKNQKYKCLEAARKRLKELQQITSTF